MDMQSSVSSAALGKALDQQMLGAAVITKTLNKISESGGGVTAAPSPERNLQASAQSAYAQMGIGTKVDAMV